MATRGRPRIIATPDEAWERGQAYFAEREAQEKPITVTGLAIALGLCTRDSLIDYQNRPEFSDTIKALKAIVEDGYETRLHGQSPTGAIFALKNFGWKDKQDVDMTQHKGYGWE